MPHVQEALRVEPLPAEVRRQSLIGAEVILPTGMRYLDPEALAEPDKKTLREGLFKHGVLVFRNQDGINPAIMPEIGKFFDETAWNIHSGGEKKMSNKKNILSQNRGARLPRAPQVTVIGKGKWTGHEGLDELDLKHVVSRPHRTSFAAPTWIADNRGQSHTEFHARPHTQEEIDDGFTRPYRWHMDAPLYDVLPGYVTTLHSLKNPDLPDQKLRFPSGEVLPVAAGATACRYHSGREMVNTANTSQSTPALVRSNYLLKRRRHLH